MTAERRSSAVWPGRVRAFQEEVESSSSSSADDTSSVQNGAPRACLYIIST